MTGSLTIVDPGGNGVPATWQSMVSQIASTGVREQKRKRAQHATRRAAERWHNERLMLANEGKVESAREVRAREEAERKRQKDERAKESETCIGALLDVWISNKKASLQGATHARYVGLGERIKPLVGAVPVAQFRRPDAKVMFGKLAASGGVKGKPLGGSTVRQARVVLSQTLDEAVEKALILTNVVRGLKLALPATAEREPPCVDDLRRLVAASALVEDLAVPVLLAVSCGLRLGETLGLTWAAVDLENAKIQVRASLEEVGAILRLKEPKTKRSRRPVEIPPSVVSALRVHRSRQREWALKCGPDYDRAADLVNPGPDGKPWRPSTFTDRYRALAQSLGVKGTYHYLRHAHASGLIEAGTDARTVANRLGHANVAFTMQRYVHSGSVADRRAALTFEDFLRGPSPDAANEAVS